MALIIENGTIVANANSYVSVSVLNDYLSSVGVTTTANDATKETYLILAMQYIEALRNKFKGSKVSSLQLLQWPRKDVEIDGFDILETVMPTELIKAQCQLVVEQIKGKPLFPSAKTVVNEGAVIEKTVGPLTKKFAASNQLSSTSPIMFASVNAFLNALTTSYCGPLTTVRA